ncbi:MAG: O-methyltransferase [Actinomycetota bacterium]|nr:O-methyltransferase [Actinomycetota bacterium]
MRDLVSADAAAYADACTTAFAGQLSDVVSWTQAHTSSPVMLSGVAEARLLEALIVLSGATRVLEIGTFTGFGTLAMAAALGPGGRVTTLEVDEQMAAVARGHFDASSHPERIELIVGDALQTLSRLKGPFDLVYIDAWKSDYPSYYEAVLPKLAPRGVIVADNLFRGGSALDPGAEDESTVGIRQFARQVQADERVHNVLLTVGDGLMLTWHRPTPRGGPGGA